MTYIPNTGVIAKSEKKGEAANTTTTSENNAMLKEEHVEKLISKSVNKIYDKLSDVDKNLEEIEKAGTETTQLYVSLGKKLDESLKNSEKSIEDLKSAVDSKVTKETLEKSNEDVRATINEIQKGLQQTKCGLDDMCVDFNVDIKELSHFVAQVDTKADCACRHIKHVHNLVIKLTDLCNSLADRPTENFKFWKFLVVGQTIFNISFIAYMLLS